MSPDIDTSDYEEIVERFYRRLLVEGDTCMDVGAHVGRHLYPMLECVGRRGRILAFEPIPELASALEDNVRRREMQGAVSVHQVALADRCGTGSFVVAVDAPGYSGLRQRAYDVPTSTRVIQVSLSTLDVVMSASGLTSMDYVKIDAEGAEYSILRGGARTLARARPVVSFEFGEASYAAYDVEPEAVHAYLSAFNYGIYDIRSRKLDVGQFCRSARKQELWDYFAIPGERDAAGLLAHLPGTA
jgi:FkbM family methyltransferase